MITYNQIRTLRTRGPIEQLPDRGVDGVLLVGQEPAIEFEDRHSIAGHDRVALYPAFGDAEALDCLGANGGARCWLELRRWVGAHGYSAHGAEERLITFEAGVRIFLERGVFAFDVPPGLAEELAGMDPADRAVAERVADLPLIDPAPGYEDRAVERARREGLLP